MESSLNTKELRERPSLNGLHGYWDKSGGMLLLYDRYHIQF